MVASLLEEHIKPRGIREIKDSELFRRDNEILQKDKELIEHVISKRCSDLNTKEVTKLKDIVRSHTPSSSRVSLWMMLSGGAQEMSSTQVVYDETCERLFSEGKFEPEELGDVNEQRMVTFHLNKDGICKVQKVLIVIKDLHPDITYCPLLEPLVAVMLHFMGEKECYSCICGILSKSSSFLEQTKFDNACTDMALQELLKDNNRKAYIRLKSFLMNGTEEDEDFVDTKTVLFPLWRNMIFERLDFLILVRIVDCLLVEGAKILYRVALYLLNVFYSYTLTFKNMQFSDSQDLIAAIGQHSKSLDPTAESFLKAVLKLKFTTKNLSKIRGDNSKLYKQELQEYAQSDAFNSFTKQVVAVDLNKVSDIIKPYLWLQICEWLPSRIQLKQPCLLFSTNTNGFNLKTLYHLCDEEEQTLFIIQISSKETIGCYLSAALSERTVGHNNLSYFGTGETFIFRLDPLPVCYLWDKGVDVGGSHGQRNKYVFIDKQPISFETSNRRFSRRRSSLRKNFMRRLSRRLSRQNFSRSISVPHHDDFAHTEPLSALHLKSKNAENISLLNNEGARKKVFQRHNSLPSKPPVTMKISDTILSHSPPSTKLEFRGLDEETNFTENAEAANDDENEDEVPPVASLFISCDNSSFTVGGGNGEGLYFDGELTVGRSTTCDTYQNESLTCNEGGDFSIIRLDVFGFL